MINQFDLVSFVPDVPMELRAWLFPDLAAPGLRKRMMTMVASCLKSEASGDHKRIENLVERQDWLDNLRKVKNGMLRFLK